MLPDLPKTGIVIPCYNEADRLPVDNFKGFIKRFPDICFCFVNDGSSDNTGQVLEELAGKETVTVINLETNQGKAEAVRSGINYYHSRQGFELVGYWDADLATALDEIPRFMEIFDQRPHVQLVCGARLRKMGSEIERDWYRHYLGRVFASLVGLITGLPVYDSQCGAKLMKTPLATDIFHEPFITRWLFDVELLMRIITERGKEETLKAVFEIPLNGWQDKKGSKVTFLQFLRTPWEIFKIFRRYSA